MPSLIDNDELVFLDEEPLNETTATESQPRWRVLIVDDEKDVHSATLLAIADLTILGQKVEFLHAYSALQAQEVLANESDIAVILLDVVMESSDAGLQLVFHIRNRLRLTDVRIILRTGQPGYSPEIETIRDYDINDYRTKSELTRTKLFTAITAAVRSYKQIREANAVEVIKASEKQVRNMLESSPISVQVMNLESRSLIFSNHAAGELFKLPIHQLAGINPGIFYQKIDDFNDLMDRMQHEDNVLNVPLGMRVSTGEEIWVLASYIHVTYDNAPCLLFWIFDATDIKVASDKLRASEGHYREQSITDELTKLYNVRHFNERIALEISRSERYNRPLSLLFIDVDHFKNYNDAYGHREGDRVLECLGELIGSCLRTIDSAYRYGGEEFVVLLPETDSGGAYIVAERLRQLFEQHDFSTPAGANMRCTVSIGIAERKDVEKADTFIKRADAALYDAKHGGRNRVVIKI